MIKKSFIPFRIKFLKDKKIYLLNNTNKKTENFFRFIKKNVIHV